VRVVNTHTLSHTFYANFFHHDDDVVRERTPHCTASRQPIHIVFIPRASSFSTKSSSSTMERPGDRRFRQIIEIFNATSDGTPSELQLCLSQGYPWDAPIPEHPPYPSPSTSPRNINDPKTSPSSPPRHWRPIDQSYSKRPIYPRSDGLENSIPREDRRPILPFKREIRSA
jgi:hypothetical protein